MTSPSARLARVADQLYAAAPWSTRTLQRLRPFICPFEALIECVPHGSSVLDVGCGPGLFLGLLATHGRLARGIGFDASAKAISAARRLRAALPPAVRDRIAFRRLRVEDPWPEGRHDVVALIDVLHHVAPAQHEAVVRRACAAVRPGGLLLYKDIGARPGWRRAANTVHDLLLARQLVSYAPLESVAGWAHDGGLTVDITRRLDRWWYPHDLALFRRASGP